MKKIVISLLFLAFFTANLYAGSLGDNLKEDQVKDILKLGNTMFSMRPLNPASSKGMVFGIEAGLASNITPTDFVSDFADLPGYMPSPSLYLGLGAPLGLGLEAEILKLPKIKGYQFMYYGGNLFWSADFLLAKFVPFLKTALRITYSNYSFDMVQKRTVSAAGQAVGTEFTANIQGTTKGGNLSASFAIPVISSFFEPYVGFGVLNQSGEASADMLAAGVNAADAATQSSTSPHLFAGVQLKLFLIALNLEYDSLFGQSSYAAKLSFKLGI